MSSGRPQAKDIDEQEFLAWLRDNAGSWPCSIYEAFARFPFKVVDAKITKLLKYIEWGVSTNYPWLTPEGEERLLALER